MDKQGWLGKLCQQNLNGLNQPKSKQNITAGKELSIATIDNRNICQDSRENNTSISYKSQNKVGNNATEIQKSRGGRRKH